jgi:hypothetical protein
LGSDIESIYRYSSKGRYYWANLAEGRAQPIANNKPISHPSFSPDNRHLVYQFENNLYLKNLSDATERAITTDGEKNAIIHGSGDWVYEEEFTLVKAFDFSADGRWLAWLRFDERNVPEFHMPMFKGNLYPEDVRFKYPKVGQPNSRVELMLCEMPEGQPKRISLAFAFGVCSPAALEQSGAVVFNGLKPPAKPPLAVLGKSQRCHLKTGVRRFQQHLLGNSRSHSDVARQQRVYYSFGAQWF